MIKLKIHQLLGILSSSKYPVPLGDPEMNGNYVLAIVAFSDKEGPHIRVGVWMVVEEEGKGAGELE